MSRRQTFIHKASESLQGQVPGPLLVEGWSADPDLQSKWEKWGFVALFPMSEHGLYTNNLGETAVVRLFDNSTVEGSIVTKLVEGYQAGWLRPDAYINAVHELEIGTFDRERWQELLARHPD